MPSYTPQQQSAIDAVLNARRNDASIPGGMTDAQRGNVNMPQAAPASNVPSSSGGASNPWSGFSGMGSVSTPSAYVEPAAKNNVVNMPQAYSGPSSIIGNTSSFGSDMGKGHQNLANSTFAQDPSRTQLNTWADKTGNVYDTTNMTPQQIYAMGLAKDNNPKATAILQGMGLDMNGNPTSSAMPMSSSDVSAQGGTATPQGNGSDFMKPLSFKDGSGQTGAVFAPPPTVKTDQLIPNAGTGGGVQLAGGGFIPQSNPYGALSPDQIKAQAAAQIAAQTADKTRIANQTKTGYQTSYDRMNAANTDTRNLENFKNSQLLNPFNGYSDYAQGEIARQRGTTDRQNQQDLQTKLGNVDTQLQDYLNSTPAEQQKIINDMTDKERSYFLQTNAQALQAQQLTQTQSNADRTFNYNAGRDTKNDAITADNTAYNRTQDVFKNDISKSGVTGYYQDTNQTAAVQKQMAANSAAYASASPDEQQRLHDENVRLAASIGGQDTTGSGDYSFGQGQRTLAGKTLDLNNAKDMATLTGYMPDGKGGYIPTNAKQQQDLSNAWHESEQLGYVTRSLSALSGIPVGTQTQAAKNQAAQISISARNAANSEASTANSNANAKERIAWDKDPNNPDNKLKESTITKNNAPKPKTPDSYKTDPNFATDVAHMKSNPTDANKLNTNSQQFIDAYGYDGYLALRKAAALD